MKYRSLLLAMVLCLPMAMHAGDAHQKTKAQIGLVLAVGLSGAAGGFAGAHYWHKQERDALKGRLGALEQQMKEIPAAAASSTQPQEEHWKEDQERRIEDMRKDVSNLQQLVGASVLARGSSSVLASLAIFDERLTDCEKSRLVEVEASSSANAEEPAGQ